MNPIQRFYEYKNETGKIIRNTNSYYHRKNLETIKNRKSQYLPVKTFSSAKKNKRNIQEPFKNYFVIKTNKSITHRLMDIKFAPIKPLINKDFFIKHKQINDYKKVYKLLDDKHLKEENERYKMRLSYQKNFIKLRLNVTHQNWDNNKSYFPKITKYNGSKSTANSDYFTERNYK